jgi:hypothetical protein
MQIALAARVEPPDRLIFVVDELLKSAEELDRARATYVAGWMPHDSTFRARIVPNDPSPLVRRIAEAATHRLDRERWAHHWVSRFLFERRAERRWAAGRLFVACSDAATPFWAKEMIWNASGVPAIRRAEASLLLDTLRKKPDDSELRDVFLGYRVRELEGIVTPWRHPIRWEDIDVTKPADDD